MAVVPCCRLSWLAGVLAGWLVDQLGALCSGRPESRGWEGLYLPVAGKPCRFFCILLSGCWGAVLLFIFD